MRSFRLPGWSACAAVAACAGFAAPVAAEEADAATGRPLLQLRPRLSYVEQSNKAEHAEALNMRTLLGYRADRAGEFAFVAELVDVSWVHPLHANDSPATPTSPYPLVGDPPVTDVNQLYVEYAGLASTRVRIGRQAVRLDNQRFVGDADVRQIPQVMDAVTVHNTSLPATRLFAGYAWGLRTFFGHTRTLRTILANLRTDLGEGLSLGAYGYFDDHPRTEFGRLKNNGNRIVGVRAEGDQAAGRELSWYYAAEAALQRPYAGGDAVIRASYARLAVGPSWDGWSLQAGWERLGSNGGHYGLQAPLSFNTFQGWSYEFSNTPPTGVRDLSLSASYDVDRGKLWLRHHRFETDFGGQAVGREWDAAALLRIDVSWSLRALFTDFRPAAGSNRPGAKRHSLTLQYDY